MWIFYNGIEYFIALLKPDGTLAATYYYDAFGNITDTTGSVSNNITFSGYQYDKETGLYYLNARMYDPKTARFLQEDTYLGDRNDPLSLNLYTYCRNDPVMYWDPTGHKDLKFSEVLKAAGAGTPTWDSKDKTVTVTISGVTRKFKYSKIKSIDGNSIIDSCTFYSRFSDDSSGITIATSVDDKTGKIKCDKTIRNTVKTTKTVDNTYKPKNNVSGSKTNKGTGNSEKTSLLNTAINVTKDFIAGVAVSGDNNLFFGAAQGINGKTVTNDTIAFQVGKVSGDACSMIVGIASITTGAGGELIGVALDGTVVLAPAGIPTAAASAGLIGYGGTATYRSVNNTSKMQVILISNITKGGE